MLEERAGSSAYPVEQLVRHPYYIDALAVQWYDPDLDSQNVAMYECRHRGLDHPIGRPTPHQALLAPTAAPKRTNDLKNKLRSFFSACIDGCAEVPAPEKPQCKMKHWIRILLTVWIAAACIGGCVAFLLISSPFGQLIGKGEFVSYEASDRSRLRPEDRYLSEFLPPQATSINVWSFRFQGHWGGHLKIEKPLLEAWAKERELLPYHGIALIDMYQSKTKCEFIDTSHGVVYRELELNGRQLQREYLLYYDDNENLAYFNLTIE